MSNQATRLAEARERLRKSIGWLRDGIPCAYGIGVEDMVVIEEALADLTKPAVSEEAQWQPMEAAPTTRRILVFDGEITIAWWDDDRGEWWADGADWTDAAGQPLYPKYWMPLPEAPAARAQSSKGDEGMQHE